VRIPDDFLEKPAVKAVLDAIGILRCRYGNHVAIVGKAMGPWTLAYHMHGVEAFLIETIIDRDKTHRFLNALKEITILFALAQIRAGADVICIGDHATGDLVGPWTYREYLPQYHKEMTQRIGCPVVFHCCGNTLDRLDYICESGFDCFHFESKVDAVDAVTKVDGRISLMGNLNNPESLLNGTANEISEQSRYAIEAGVQVIGPECAIPLRTPLQNLKAIATTARKTGEP
jgi:[methyl-Co(III) methanol-specific corrinoid protein]:coenzyme M methyltransferase